MKGNESNRRKDDFGVAYDNPKCNVSDKFWCKIFIFVFEIHDQNCKLSVNYLWLTSAKKQQPWNQKYMMTASTKIYLARMQIQL